MKKFTIFLALLFLLAFVTEAQAVFIPFVDGATADTEPVLTFTESENGIHVSLEIPGISTEQKVIENTVYNKFSVKSFGISGLTGEPEIPFKGVYFEVPVGVSLSVSNLVKTAYQIPGTYLVYPCQSQLLNDEEHIFDKSEQIYSQNHNLPDNLICIEKDSLMRGRRVIFIPIKCLITNPIERSVIGFSRIEFDIIYSGTPDPDAITAKQRLSSPYFESVQRSMILNYANVQQNKSSAPGDGCDYLFIAHEYFSNVLEPLIQWKKLKGFITKVIYLNDENCTDPQEIKSLIQAEYNKTPAPAFVCICGDTNDVETYQKPSNYNYHTFYASDYEYSMLDSGDFFPDVNLGRILANTPERFSNFVDKLMNYERFSSENDTYFEDWLFSGAFIDYESPGDQEDQYSAETTLHFYEDSINNNRVNSHFVVFQDRVIPGTDWTASNRSDDYPNRPDNRPNLADYSEDIQSDITVATDELLNSWNNGLGLITYIGHGLSNKWCTDSRAFSSVSTPPGDTETEFFGSENQLQQLENNNKTPVVISLCCLSGYFLDAESNLSQSLLCIKDKGAASVIAASHNSLANGPTVLLGRGIYDGFFPDYDTNYNDTNYQSSMRVSDALNHGKLYMTNYWYNGSDESYMRHLFHLFGDPEMMIRTSIPRAPQVTLPTYIDPGTTIITIVSSDEGAQIGISQAGNLIGSGRVINGSAVINLWEPVLADIDVLMVITGYNLATVEQVIPTHPQSSQTLGTIEFNKDQYQENDTGDITVIDPDMNLDKGLIDSVFVTLSSSIGLNTSLELMETGSDTGIFEGSVKFVKYEAGDGEFQVLCGGTIQAVYFDSTFDPETDVETSADIVCKPRILFGGLLDTYLITDADQLCGRVNALMCVEKNDHTIAQAGLTELPIDPWQEPVIIWDMYESSSNENYYYRYETFNVDLPQSGEDFYTFGMAVTDGGENYSHHWPYMPVQPDTSSNNPTIDPLWYENLVQVPNAAPSTETLQMYQNTIQHLQAANAGPGEKPIIWAAGYLDSDLRAGEPGVLKIGAVVTQDQYGHGIDRIEVLDWDYYPRFSLSGPGTLVDGFYLFYNEWTMNEVPNLIEDDAFFRMRIVNSDGSMGDYWPHFKKFDANQVAPENLIASSSDSSITLNWYQDNSIEINHFTVSWINTETNQTEHSGNIDYDITSYEITGLSNCVTYDLYVTAYDLCGNALTSEHVSSTPSLEPIPQDVRIRLGEENQFVISWEPTSTGLYALYEGFSNNPEEMTFLSFHSTNVITQPEIGDYAKFFAVRSCVSYKIVDLEFASCFSEVVRGQKIPNGAGIVQKVTLIDVNNDGFEDLVLISEDSRLKIYLGQSDGSWILSSQSFPSTVKDYTLFDFNKDGSVDLAVAAPNEVKTYFNDGSGNMTITESLFPPGDNEVIASDDLDNKGTSDVLVGNSSGTLVKVNNEQGQTEEVQYLDSGNTKVLVAEDLDGDGKKDLITATETGENVVWTKDATGLFVNAGQNIFTWGTESIEAQDVNGDGCIDLIVTDSNDETVIFINDCTGNFTVQ